MRCTLLGTLLLLLPLLAFHATTTQAGFLDGVIDKAKQATEAVVNETTDKLIKDQPANSEEPTPAKKPNQAGETAASSTEQAAATPAAELPEPTMGHLMLAAIHFRPSLLDKESTFKRVLLTVHPDKQPILSNEFQWHKQKNELKQQLLNEARNARLNFEVRPWRESSVSGDRPIELYNYDFDRQAYRVRFATGTVKKFLGLPVPGRSAPETRYAWTEWLAMKPERAEQIANRFGNNKRILYLGYRIQVTGALIETGKPIPVIAFGDDQFDLYQRQTQQQGNTMVPQYQHLGAVKISLADNPRDVPIVRQPPDPDAPKTSEVVRNAQIDGVKLGMPIEKALSELKQRGYEMEAPGHPRPQTGVTVKGKGTTADGAGWIEIMLRQMDGKVYQIKKDIGYLTSRLPEDLTVATLHEQYWQELTSPFSGARYEHPVQNRGIHFDDISPPPYNRKVTSPHAEVFISPSGQNYYGGRWGASVDFHWKDLVGADW